MSESKEISLGQVRACVAQPLRMLLMHSLTPRRTYDWRVHQLRCVAFQRQLVMESSRMTVAGEVGRRTSAQSSTSFAREGPRCQYRVDVLQV